MGFGRGGGGNTTYKKGGRARATDGRQGWWVLSGREAVQWVGAAGGQMEMEKISSIGRGWTSIWKGVLGRDRGSDMGQIK